MLQMFACAKIPRRIGTEHAIIALLLMAVLSTAAIIHLIWHRTAAASVESMVSILDAQAGNVVRREIASDLAAVASTAAVIRSAFAQSVVTPDDFARRESLFSSLMKEQPAITWIGIAFADGRFYGSHKTRGGKVETIVIDASAPTQPHELSFDGTVRLQGQYLAKTSRWYRSGVSSERLTWSVVDTLPLGVEPAIVVSGKVELPSHDRGVVMVAVSLRRLSAALRSLVFPKGGKVFMLAPSTMVLATSGAEEGVMIGRLRDFPKSDALASTVQLAQKQQPGKDYRTLISSEELGPVFVWSSKLPFQDWQIIAAIPRAVLAADNDANGQRIILVVSGVALAMAASAVALIRALLTRPLSALAKQLQLIGKFEFEAVTHRPTILAELDDFSNMLKRMSNGLSAFAKYLPIEVVRPLIESNAELRPGGDLREITVMFADLPGFTELTENLGAKVEPSLTQFLSLSTAAIHAERGTVDKFIGDAVMAIWNAPGYEPDHALRACRAAVAIRNAMHALPPMAAKHDNVRIRIGIHTGVALVGNIGSSQRLSYTAIGDVVNLASRLVGVARDHTVEIVLSAETLANTGGLFAAESIGPVNIRGIM
jgi:class 3 adenylate cyclase